MSQTSQGVVDDSLPGTTIRTTQNMDFCNVYFFLEVLISKVDMKWDEGVILPALINMKLT